MSLCRNVEYCLMAQMGTVVDSNRTDLVVKVNPEIIIIVTINYHTVRPPKQTIPAIPSAKAEQRNGELYNNVLKIITKFLGKMA